MCALQTISEFAKKGDISGCVVNMVQTHGGKAYFSTGLLKNGYADCAGRIHAALDSCKR